MATLYLTDLYRTMLQTDAYYEAMRRAGERDHDIDTPPELEEAESLENL